MSRRWWRRNAVALAAVAVLLPVTALVIGGNEWWLVNQSRPVVPTTVPAGTGADWAGMRWGPATLRELPSDAEDGLPPGAKVVVVEVPVDPGGHPVACSAPVLRELDGAQRQWDDAASEVDWDYDRPTACVSDADGPYTVAAPFLIPGDAAGPFGVELTVVDELPAFLRLVVVP
jgi:hypothetical protein